MGAMLLCVGGVAQVVQGCDFEITFLYGVAHWQSDSIDEDRLNTSCWQQYSVYVEEDYLVLVWRWQWRFRFVLPFRSFLSSSIFLGIWRR